MLGNAPYHCLLRRAAPIGIEYRDANAAETMRVIHPIALEGDFDGQILNVTHIEARCTVAKAIRTFRVDRIQSLYDPRGGEELELTSWLQNLDRDLVVQTLPDTRPGDAFDDGVATSPATKRTRWGWIAFALALGYAIGRFRLINDLLVATHQHWGRWL